MRWLLPTGLTLAVLLPAADPRAAGLDQPPNSWVKRSPLADTPPSPRLGYEGACAWDSRQRVLLRYAGHNQGGGGEQHSEVWTFEPLSARWTLKEPNTSPPGLCCGQQNVFDPAQGRYLRFPSFSGSHGWQWWREIYLNDSSVWSYDLASNVWRNLRPLPATQPRPLRCAAWDSEHQVVVLFGGETSTEGTLVYDPHDNSWTRLKPARQPAFRSGGNLAYDAARKLHVLFGAQFSDDPHTWGYDLRRNEWRDLQPPTLPPTDKNDAVLTYDPRHRRVLAIVKITEGKDEEATHRLETWAFDAGANRWTKMNPPREPDASGNRARNLVFAPELNVALLENRTHGKNSNEQQIWTYRFGDVPPAAAGPEPPAELRVTTTADSATLTWKPGPSPHVAGYAIYRGAADKPWQADYRKVATVPARQADRYRDTALKAGALHCYAVRAVAADGSESAERAKVRTQPRVVEDLVASVLSPGRVELSWAASPETDVAGYHVERAPVEVFTEDQLKRLKKQTPPLPEPSVGAFRRIGAFSRLTSAALKAATYTDTGVDLGKPAAVTGEAIHERPFNAEQFDDAGKAYRFGVFAYRVRAVNALGVESGPSPPAFTIPSAPQWLFAREDGAACELKWAANPERGLRGYRVYRLNGRYDKDPIARLTEEPVSALTYRDDGAGKATRRYHVVAVDALGQEGFPSSPAWFEREWKKYYLPFTGPWHQ